MFTSCVFSILNSGAQTDDESTLFNLFCGVYSCLFFGAAGRFCS